MEAHELVTRGPLFEAVQAAGVFPDCKTFVDAVPRGDPAAVRDAFDPGGDIAAFVADRFELPGTVDAAVDASDIDGHITAAWDALTRPGGEDRGAYIGLPNPYVVPGGRFREGYYWDAYFTMLGLARDGREGLVDGMVANLAALVDRFGFVPTANRTYYRSRSHPPFLGEMLDLLADVSGFDRAAAFLPQLEAEYRFWMGTERAVETGAGVLNRYWDDDPRPRPESYRADRATARGTGRGDDLFRDIRAACESGWDFSTRWTDGGLASIRTTAFLPVDLNALLHGTERRLAAWHRALGNDEHADRYARRAHRRADAFDLFWDDGRGFYVDHDHERGGRSDSLTLAGVFPLFTGTAPPDRAARVADTLRDRFLRDGGLVTTLAEGFQWDAPNGWAPLQYAAVEGLRRYGHDALAREIADRWRDTCRTVFADHGVMLEKYNVVEPGAMPADGEYRTQVGFGWTNGVYRALDP